MTKYYIVDPWYTDISIQGKRVNAIFDTGNASNSFISCKRFPNLPRIQIPVPVETVQYFNKEISPLYNILPIQDNISMKDLYKHIQGKIPRDKYIDIMKSLGFVFIQGVSGSSHIINLEISITGVPFSLTARLYCSYVSDIEYDVLFSVLYIASLLDKRIMVSPMNTTKNLYIDSLSLMSRQSDESVSDKFIDNMSLIIQKRQHMKFPAREVLLSAP